MMLPIISEYTWQGSGAAQPISTRGSQAAGAGVVRRQGSQVPGTLCPRAGGPAGAETALHMRCIPNPPARCAVAAAAAHLAGGVEAEAGGHVSVLQVACRQGATGAGGSQVTEPSRRAAAASTEAQGAADTRCCQACRWPVPCQLPSPPGCTPSMVLGTPTTVVLTPFFRKCSASGRRRGAAGWSEKGVLCWQQAVLAARTSGTADVCANQGVGGWEGQGGRDRRFTRLA